MKLVLRIALLLIGAAVFPSPGSVAASPDDPAAPWRAVISAEATSLYRGVSATSESVKLLKRGDHVDIDLEIVADGGKWYAVTLPGADGLRGYVDGRTLEFITTFTVLAWEYKPPPPPVTEKVELLPEPKAGLASLVQRDVKRFFASTFGRTLPVSAFGQTRLHNSFGFDHRNAVDVAVHPDSLAGRLLIEKLRKEGVPFLTFRSAKAGIATGPHIHVGLPSRRR